MACHGNGGVIFSVLSRVDVCFHVFVNFITSKSKCCIEANWTCFGSMKTFHLSSEKSLGPLVGRCLMGLHHLISFHLTVAVKTKLWCQDLLMELKVKWFSEFLNLSLQIYINSFTIEKSSGLLEPFSAIWTLSASSLSSSAASTTNWSTAWTTGRKRPGVAAADSLLTRSSWRSTRRTFHSVDRSSTPRSPPSSC